MFDASRKPRKNNPRETANIFSRLTFLYTTEIYTKSKKHDLEEDDIYTIVNNCRSDVACDILEKQWNNELKKKNTSLIRTLVHIFGWEYTLYGFLNFLIKTPLLAITPYATGILVSYFEPSSTTTQNDAIICGCVLIACGILDALYTNYYNFALQRLALRIEVSVCALVYRKALKLSERSLNELSGGRIMTLIARDSMAVSSSSLLFLHSLWIGVLQVVIVMGIMYNRVGASTLVGIGFFMAVIPMQMWIGVKIKQFWLRTLALTDERLQRIQEILTSIRLIKLYCWERYFIKIIHSLRSKEMLKFRNTLFLRAVILSMSSLSYRISYFLCIFAYYMLGDNISPEELFFLVTCYKTLDSLLSNAIPSGITMWAEGRSAAERFQSFLLMEERELQNVPNNPVLNEINMKSARPLLIGINGEVGSGKTTLLKTLLDVKGISYASQEPWLFPGTIRENVLFGDQYNPARYQQVMKVCGLVNELKDCTLVIDKGLNLSKGQQARVNLARAVYRKADVYLLDDVLSSLDLNVGEYVFANCIKGFLKDKRCLLVCQNEDFLARTDRIITLKGGDVEIISDSQKCNYQKRLRRQENFEEKGGNVQNDNEEGGSVQINNEEGECVQIDDEEKKYHQKEDTNINEDRINTNITDPRNLKINRDIDEDRKLYKEHKVSGKVHRKIYYKYFAFAGGWRIILPVLSICLATQSIGIIFDYYANQWLDVEAKMIEIYNNKTTVSDLEDERRRVISLYAGILAVFACFVVVEYFSFFAMVVRASRNVHMAVFERIMGATMSFFDTHFSGSLANRFSRDMGGVDGCGPGYLDCAKATFELTVITSLIIYLNPMLCIPALIFFLVLLYGAKRFVQASRSLRRMEPMVRAPCVGFLNASLEGLTTINAFGNQKILKEQFDRHQSHYSGVVFMIFTTKSAFGLWLSVIGSLFSACVIFSFIIFYEKLENIAGDVGVAVTQAIGISSLLQGCVYQWAELENAMTAVERVLEYAEAEQEETTGESPQDWPKNPKIQYTNVTMKYTNSIDVLRGITFSIPARRKVGIVGRTGAGKSSIISALFRLYNSEGLILIDDIDTSKIKLSTLRSKISIIPQDPIMFKGSIRTNLDPNNLYADHELWDVLEKVGLKNSVCDLELSNTVEEGGLNFSIGQRQLFSLARVLLSNNRIVILDEATANMDPETDDFIRGMIERLFADCTVITIAHKINTLMSCEQFMVVRGGEVTERGSTEELMNKDFGYLNSIMK